MTDLSSDRLEEIEQRCKDLDRDEYNQGVPKNAPWRTQPRSLHRWTVYQPIGPQDYRLIADRLREPFAEFIAGAREDVPWLLSELRDARAEIVGLRANVETLVEEVSPPEPNVSMCGHTNTEGDVCKLPAGHDVHRDGRGDDWGVCWGFNQQDLDSARVEIERLRELPYLSGNWVAEEIVDDLRAKLASAEKRHNKLRSALSCVHMDLTARSVAADDLVKILELDAAALTEGGAE